ncbi:hypothetical protein UT300003_32330 [Clostridium sardiniense]
MAFIDLLELKPKKVSKEIKDYSLMITAPSGFGKTPFLAELFGEEAIFLALENSVKGIPNVYGVDIDSYTALEFYIGQLERPEVREKFNVVVIDTLNMLDFMCETAVTDQYGKDLIGDCLAYNKGYKVLDKKFVKIIKRLQKMDYSLVYVCHPVEKKLTINGAEYTRYDPKVSDRIQTWLIPEVDIRLFCHYNENGEKTIYTQGTQFFDARVRGASMEPMIPFDAQKLKEAFAKGIEKGAGKENLVDKIENKNNTATEVRPFEEVFAEVQKLGAELYQAGKSKEADKIVFQALGCDVNGNQRTLNDVTPEMASVLELICMKLKEI